MATKKRLPLWRTKLHGRFAEKYQEKADKQKATVWLERFVEAVEKAERTPNSKVAEIPIGYAGFVKRMILELFDQGQIKFKRNHGGGQEKYDNSWNVKLMGFELQLIGVEQVDAHSILGLGSEDGIEQVSRHRKEVKPLFKFFGEETNKQEFWDDYLRAQKNQIVDEMERFMLLTRSQSIKELLARDEAKEDDPDGNIMKLLIRPYEVFTRHSEPVCAGSTS